MSCVEVAIMHSGLTLGPPFKKPSTYSIVSTSAMQLSLPTLPSRPPSARGSASEIIPRLFISDLSFAENSFLLRSHGITHILSTLPDSIAIPDTDYPPPRRMQIKVEDFPFAELAAYLPGTTRFIRDALQADPGARVLVHCGEGVSRSVSVVAAFLMDLYSWTPTEALKFIKQKRRQADPNFGFVQQLHEYGRDCLGQRTEIPLHSQI